MRSLKQTVISILFLILLIQNSCQLPYNKQGEVYFRIDNIYINRVPEEELANRYYDELPILYFDFLIKNETQDSIFFIVNRIYNNQVKSKLLIKHKDLSLNLYARHTSEKFYILPKDSANVYLLTSFQELKSVYDSTKYKNYGSFMAFIAKNSILTYQVDLSDSLLSEREGFKLLDEKIQFRKSKDFEIIYETH